MPDAEQGTGQGSGTFRKSLPVSVIPMPNITIPGKGTIAGFSGANQPGTIQGQQTAR